MDTGTFVDHTKESSFMDFIKEQDESSLEDLIRLLEAEQKWNLDGDDVENGDDEEEEEEEDNSNIDEDMPIADGHFLTVKTSVLLIWLLAMTHSFTSQMLADTLTVINLHLLVGYPALKSVYRFKRYFGYLKSTFVKHYYCSFCSAEIEAEEKVCPNDICGKTLKNSKEYFLELPILSQLNAMFAREEFREGLKNKSQRVKRKENNIEDVYDCENYKLLFGEKKALNENNESHLSFIFNTDGIPIFKSSKTSIWPIFLMINELPYRMRKSRENMVMCGLWFGKSKPDMNMFCNFFHQSLMNLQNGVIIKPNGTDQSFKVYGFLYSVSCDIPARSVLMNMNQHNGESCCPKCLQTGKNLRTPTGGNIRIFPYQEADSAGPKRNAHGKIEDAHKCSSSKVGHINGIKGPSILMFCPKYDPVQNVSIDIMHLLFLGIVRMLMKLWFNVSHSLHSFSLYRYIDIIDERLLNIKPSHFVTRMPRSIADSLKFWKAAEYRSWFFYYSVPCIADFMHPRFLYHYCALLEAIFLLNQSSISAEDIVKSERLLNYFVYIFPCLYGERYMTINMHSLLHLPDMVCKIGPLWATSCFPFESANGELLKLFHGTQFIDIQIINAVHVFQMLPSLSNLTISSSPRANELVSSLLRKNLPKMSHFHLCGKGYEKEICEKEIQMILRESQLPGCKFVFHSRAKLRGIMYHSVDYSRTKRRNSYTVKFKNSKGLISYGFVCWYVECCHDYNTNKNNIFACISVLCKENRHIFDFHHLKIEADNCIKSNFLDLCLPNIHFMVKSDVKCIVPVQNILDLCLYIETDKLMLVCDEPNHFEVNL